MPRRAVTDHPAACPGDAPAECRPRPRRPEPRDRRPTRRLRRRVAWSRVLVALACLLSAAGSPALAQAPTALDDEVLEPLSDLVGKTILVDVLANDSHPAVDLPTVVVMDPPEAGTLTGPLWDGSLVFELD